MASKTSGNRKPHTIYLHRSNDEFSPLWDNDAPQQEVYHYTGYEVILSGEVDMDTGDFYCQAVDGVPLVEETKV